MHIQPVTHGPIAYSHIDSYTYTCIHTYSYNKFICTYKRSIYMYYLTIYLFSKYAVHQSVFLCNCVCPYLSIYLFLRIHKDVCVFVYVYVCVSHCVNVCIFLFVCVCVPVYITVCMYVRLF